MDTRLRELLTSGDHRFTGFHRIRHADPNAGFCALMTYALNGVRRALLLDRLPVVDYTNRDVNAYFHDPERGDNVWEYYFEPVMGVTTAELDSYLEEHGGFDGLVQEDSVGEVLRWHTSDPDRVATFWAFDTPDDPAEWMARKRQLGRDFVKRFIRVKPHIQTKVSAFLDGHFQGQSVCGVHVRGTDFAYAEPTALDAYFNAIRRNHDRCSGKIFVATDQAQFVDAFRREFGEDRIIAYSAARSEDDAPVFVKDGISPYRKGEDVLIDILLLSRCGYLLKGAAAVGEYAMWFNPALECTDFAVASRYDFTSSGSAYMKMNVGGVGAGRWRGALLLSGAVKLIRRVKRPVLEALMRLGKRALPRSVRDTLWKTIFRRIY